MINSSETVKETIYILCDFMIEKSASCTLKHK